MVPPPHPWTWFLADWPCHPDEKSYDTDYFGHVTYGGAATEEQAKCAAEAALPSAEEMQKLRADADDAWQRHYRRQDEAVAEN
jgi:hypothetical protein